MMKKLSIGSILAGLAVAGVLAVSAPAAMARGDVEGPVVYVTSQGLFYDSVVLTMLPPKGPFQKIEMTGPSGLQTEFGPGDRDFVGGRWWVDVNNNHEMDGGDLYFSCPLLGPGRSEI